MNRPRTPPAHPGPWWLWVTAWSLQGAGLLVAKLIEVEGWYLELLVTGAVAAVPLAALYLFLLRSRPVE